MNDRMGTTLARLEGVVRDRLAAADPAASHVARLASKGTGAIAQKVGEEATEVVIAAIDPAAAPGALVAEAADLLFHLTVLLAASGTGWDAVAAELDRRDGVSGLAEKAARGTG